MSTIKMSVTIDDLFSVPDSQVTEMLIKIRIVPTADLMLNRIKLSQAYLDSDYLSVEEREIIANPDFKRVFLKSESVLDKIHELKLSSHLPALIQHVPEDNVVNIINSYYQGLYFLLNIDNHKLATYSSNGNKINEYQLPSMDRFNMTFFEKDNSLYITAGGEIIIINLQTGVLNQIRAHKHIRQLVYSESTNYFYSINQVIHDDPSDPPELKIWDAMGQLVKSVNLSTKALAVNADKDFIYICTSNDGLIIMDSNYKIIITAKIPNIATKILLWQKYIILCSHKIFIYYFDGLNLTLVNTISNSVPWEWVYMVDGNLYCHGGNWDLVIYNLKELKVVSKHYLKVIDTNDYFIFARDFVIINELIYILMGSMRTNTCSLNILDLQCNLLKVINIDEMYMMLATNY